MTATVTVNEWRSSPSSTLSASGSWDVRAHRSSTRAWRTTSPGYIPNKSSPFAKVVTHLLLLVHAPPAPRARARGQHHRDGQSWSSTAAPYTCRPGWHRQQPRRALSVSLGLLRAAGLAKQLSSESERSRSGSSHSTQSVAMGSDPSPATPDSAAARSAEDATVHFPAPGTPRNVGKAVDKKTFGNLAGKGPA